MKVKSKVIALIFPKCDRPYLPLSAIALIFLSADRTLREYQSKTTKYLF
jgi:hypothetical protein